MTRRTFSLGLGAATLLRADLPRTSMGIAETSFSTFQPNDTLAFLEYAHSLGAAGIQKSLTSTEPGYLRKLRDRAGELGMYLETIVPFPKPDGLPEFEAALKASKEAGAVAVRTATDGGRRYEKWKTIEAWNGFLSETSGTVVAVAKAAEMAKIPVGLENHKDYTFEELFGAMTKLGNEYFGVTLDFGNNIALLDPFELVLQMVPFAKLTHVKDISLEADPEGFLCGDLPLGEGILPVKEIVAAIRAKQPKTRFTLEMMTREPLAVPCLTEAYWTAFPARNGRALARTMSLVRSTAATHPKLPRIGSRDAASLRRLEEENVVACLYYARNNLGLV